MKSSDFVTSPEEELAKKLPHLANSNWTSIDKLMRKIAKKHKITPDELHDLFVKKYDDIPDDWIKKKKLSESAQNNLDIDEEVKKFSEWVKKRLNCQTDPIIELSRDTQEAQDEHHTGRHTEGDNRIWVYVKNRNLVDILRTVAHELTHVRQSELNMIQPGDSYPGSPIEMLADMVAGKLIKIYGKKHHYIFQ